MVRLRHRATGRGRTRHDKFDGRYRGRDRLNLCYHGHSAAVCKTTPPRNNPVAYSKKSSRQYHDHPEPREQSDSQGGGMELEVEREGKGARTSPIRPFFLKENSEWSKKTAWSSGDVTFRMGQLLTMKCITRRFSQPWPSNVKRLQRVE